MEESMLFVAKIRQNVMFLAPLALVLLDMDLPRSDGDVEFLTARQVQEMLQESPNAIEVEDGDIHDIDTFKKWVKE